MPPAWQPPSHWLRLTTIDAHAGGEPFRVVTSGWPDMPGDTILARRRHAEARLDGLRRLLMWEPRGHADMYGGVITPPVSAEADLGVLFLHNAGLSTMCGHGIIGLVTVVLETGVLPATEPETTLRIDTPAGLVVASALVRTGRVERVAFRNVPSFVLALDQSVSVRDIGRVQYDLAFGGAFYAYVDAESIGLACTPERYGDLVAAGRAVKRAVIAARPVRHPFEEDLSFLYGVVFVGPATSDEVHSRNVCVFADGEVDRSPTGTSVSARLALLHARGEAARGERLVFESIIGSRFGGRIVGAANFGPHEAVVPEVDGAAHITGRHEFLVDPSDEIGEGFLLR
jgi:trans-L-3-hydroxyproline dehydratase